MCFSFSLGLIWIDYPRNLIDEKGGQKSIYWDFFFKGPLERFSSSERQIIRVIQMRGAALGQARVTKD